MPYFQSGSHPDQKVFYIDKGDSKEVLFFIHGWYQNSRDCFGPMIDELQHTYRVVALDLPGHGSSYKHAAGDYSLLAAYRAVEDLLVRLQKENSHITVIGHSMGAFLGLKLALLHQKSVAQLVLISPVLDFKKYESKLKLWSRLPLLLWPVILRILALFNRFPFGDRKHIYSTDKGHRIPGPLEYYRIKTANHPHRIARRYMRSFQGADITPLIRNIHSPVLAIYGSEDRLVPPAFGQEMSEWLPLSIIKTVEDGGHNIQLTKTEQVLSILCEFLEEHRRKRFNWRKLFGRG